MQYDKLTFDARFLGICYICPCTKVLLLPPINIFSGWYLPQSEPGLYGR